MVGLSRIGSAHAGLTEWMLQRLTGLYLAVYIIYLILFFDASVTENYEAWKSWVDDSYVRTTLGLFFLSALVHAWIGMRSVYMDYLHSFWLRFVVTSLTGAGLVILLFWVARILLMVNST